MYRTTGTSAVMASKVAKCVAATDGLAEEERYRLTGRMAEIGAPPHVIKEVEAFDVSLASEDEVFKLFNSVDVPDEIKPGTAAFITYKSLSVVIGDGVLSEVEIQSLKSSVSVMGLSDELFDALVDLVKAEELLRSKRIGILSAAYGGSESGDSFRFNHSD